jgi:hypothetical protein
MSLHKAIARGWGCKCYESHLAYLHLSDVTVDFSKGVRLLFLLGNQSASPDQARWNWRATNILSHSIDLETTKSTIDSEEQANIGSDAIPPDWKTPDREKGERAMRSIYHV